MKTQNDAVVLTPWGVYGLVSNRRCAGGCMAYLYRLVALCWLFSAGVVYAGCSCNPLPANNTSLNYSYTSGPSAMTTAGSCSWVSKWTGAGGSTAGATASTGIVGVTCTANPVCVAPQVLSADQNSCVTPNADIAKCAAIKDGVDLFTGGSLVLTGKPYCPSTGGGSKCGGTVSGAFATVKNGVKTWTLEVTYSGAVCTPSAPTATTNEAPTPCKGQAGTVNGVSVCIPFSSSNPPAQTVGAGSVTAPDGAKTDTVSDTTCVGSKCTTTTTTTVTPVGGGAPTTTIKTEDQPKDDFCVKNPRSAMCLVSGYGSSSCGGADTCDGDAIQCAIAAKVKQTACAFDNTAAAAGEENAYTTAKGVTGDQTTGSDVNTTVAISASSFDQTELMGAAAGLSDLTVVVAGKSVTLNLSQLNQWFTVLGYLLVGVTGVLCMRIVSRG